MKNRVKSQNLSIMMTDIQGYSTTSAHVSRETIITLIRKHNQLMIPVIEFYGGKVVKTIGDAFLCTFSSATDAVICAIIIQLLLREYNRKQKDETQKLNLRVVINSGDVTMEGNDIFGDAVNITARMEGLPCFPGGTVGISEITYLLMDKGEIFAEKIGPQQLKGIPEPTTVYKIPLEKQKLTTLPVNLLELVEKVVEGNVSASPNQLEEWKNSVVTFLKEKNWGENLGQIGQNFDKAKKQIVKTFAQKTILEDSGGRTLTECKIPIRLKCFVIDFGIIIVGTFLLWLAYWPFQRILFGTSPSGFFWLISQLAALNIYLPIIPIWIYLGLFWKIRGATLGQIAGRTAVIMDDGSPLTLYTAFVRAGIFIFSNLFFGLGALMIFAGEKKTLYDKYCKTKVVELEQ